MVSADDVRRDGDGHEQARSERVDDKANEHSTEKAEDVGSSRDAWTSAGGRPLSIGAQDGRCAVILRVKRHQADDPKASMSL